jgi:hypothetical protein
MSKASSTELATLVAEGRIVALPTGQRPHRAHIDPANDGADEVSEVADRVRGESSPASISPKCSSSPADTDKDCKP